MPVQTIACRPVSSHARWMKLTLRSRNMAVGSPIVFTPRSSASFAAWTAAAWRASSS